MMSGRALSTDEVPRTQQIEIGATPKIDNQPDDQYDFSLHYRFLIDNGFWYSMRQDGFYSPRRTWIARSLGLTYQSSQTRIFGGVNLGTTLLQDDWSAQPLKRTNYLHASGYFGAKLIEGDRLSLVMHFVELGLLQTEDQNVFRGFATRCASLLLRAEY